MFKIFAVLLSLQLIIAPVAVAQSAGDTFRKAPAKNGGMDLYAQQILGLATSAIGANIITSCVRGSTILSLKVFMGASLVNIASEILGGKAQNENHKKRASSLKMLEEKMKQTPGGDLQRASLEEALKEEKETLSFINKRKMWVLAVTAGYLAAAGISIAEMINPPANTTPCNFDGKATFTAKAIAAAYSFMNGRTGGGGAISTYGGMLISLASVTGIMGTTIQKAYATPTGRAITFGASGILMGLITKGLMDRAKITKANIKKLEEALANFKDATNTNTGIATDTTSGSEGSQGAGAEFDPASGKNFAINQLPDGTTLPKECWSNSSQGMEFSSSACRSPVRLPGGGFSGELNVPTLSSAAGLTNDMAQGVASGNIGSAESSAAQLGSMAGKLKQIRDNMAKQLNDKLIAKGEKPIDFEGESQKQASQMLADFNKAAGTNMNLASLQPSDMSGAEEVKAEDEKKTDINTASAGTGIDVPSATGGMFTEGLVNDPSLTEAVAEAAPVEYEYNEDDVSDRQDVSLFEQVSNRYLFQYNKLFEKEKPRLDPVK